MRYPDGFEMRRILVAGNWKMNGDTAGSRELVGGIVAGLDGSENAGVLVCPPYPYLAAVAAMVEGAGRSLSDGFAASRISEPIA